jgi:hypothetical protein
MIAARGCFGKRVGNSATVFKLSSRGQKHFTVAELLSRLESVATTTSHIAFVYLSFDFVPSTAPTDEVANRVHFIAAYMIKFEQYRIHLTAVNTRMVSQILKYSLNNLSFSSTATTGHIGDMTRFVSGVPIPLYQSLARFAL